MHPNAAERALQVLWPSFLVAAVAEMVFFALFDPQDLVLFGEPLGASRMTIYAAGFFFFWAVASGASALTLVLRRPAEEVNRCPLPPAVRPEGCPRREAGEPTP